MPSAKKIIQRIRGINSPTPIERPEDRKRAQFRAALMREKKKEDLKVFMRDRAFSKAQAARKLQIDKQRQDEQAEADRLQAIAETRLKNLKKARRTLKKRREGETNV